MIQDKSPHPLFATSLLIWYDQFGRHLPWRSKDGILANPYYVWLSEIMLQQTTVATVKSYFEKFINKWPSIEDFAAAPLDDILHAWQGLGYYARARNMAKCAHMIVHTYQGQFPKTAVALEQLPGIGPYTAAAIASIAFEDHVTPVDGNVIRVLSRVFAIETPLPQSLKSINNFAKQLTPNYRRGDFAQALMDLGATICIPRKPKCLICPWQNDCQGFQQGIAETLPRKPLKKIKPKRYAVAFLIENEQGEFLFYRRPEKGLLGGMMEVPTTPWQTAPWPIEEAKMLSPYECHWNLNVRHAHHSFTHFDFDITIVRGTLIKAENSFSQPPQWVKAPNFSKLALPTVMKKILIYL